jgi:non-canonical purine NTP pyrophosphatase (RdgB/HAM1 family)
MQLCFVTSNTRKVNEARAACQDFGIEIVQENFDTDEIQSTKPFAVAERKAKDAFAVIKKPIVVTDTFWSIPALGGFPGAYMKEVAEWFSPQDFVVLLADKEDKRIMFSENIVYYDGQDFKRFSKEFWGKIVEPRGKQGNSIELVTEIDGLTISERHDKGEFSHKPEDYVWYDFAKWFSKQNV